MKERVSAQRLRSPLRRWQAVSTQNFERIFRLKKDKPLAFDHGKKSPTDWLAFRRPNDSLGTNPYKP
jgi:hypothetical protein